MGHGEDDVGIGDGQKFFPALLDPAQTGIGLAFRAMPIPPRCKVAGICNGCTRRRRPRRVRQRSPTTPSDAGG
jgi:hypothetical protein